MKASLSPALCPICRRPRMALVPDGVQTTQPSRFREACWRDVNAEDVAECYQHGYERLAGAVA